MRIVKFMDISIRNSIRILIQINCIMWVLSIGFILDLESKPSHVAVLLIGLFVSALLELLDIKGRKMAKSP